MDKIVLSVRKPYTDLIFDGSKTLELRKTRMRITYPAIAYVYESLHNGEGVGGVIGTIIITGVTEYSNLIDIPDRCCVSLDERYKYAGDKTIYAYDIKSAIRWDKPLPVSRFGLSRPPLAYHYIRGDGDSVKV